MKCFFAAALLVLAVLCRGYIPDKSIRIKLSGSRTVMNCGYEYLVLVEAKKVRRISGSASFVLDDFVFTKTGKPSNGMAIVRCGAEKGKIVIIGEPPARIYIDGSGVRKCDTTTYSNRGLVYPVETNYTSIDSCSYMSGSISGFPQYPSGRSSSPVFDVQSTAGLPSGDEIVRALEASMLQSKTRWTEDVNPQCTKLIGMLPESDLGGIRMIVSNTTDFVSYFPSDLATVSSATKPTVSYDVDESGELIRRAGIEFLSLSGSYVSLQQPEYSYKVAQSCTITTPETKVSYSGYSMYAVINSFCDCKGIQDGDSCNCNIPLPLTTYKGDIVSSQCTLGGPANGCTLGASTFCITEAVRPSAALERIHAGRTTSSTIFSAITVKRKTKSPTKSPTGTASPSSRTSAPTYVEDQWSQVSALFSYEVSAGITFKLGGLDVKIEGTSLPQLPQRGFYSFRTSPMVKGTSYESVALPSAPLQPLGYYYPFPTGMDTCDYSSPFGVPLSFTTGGFVSSPYYCKPTPTWVSCKGSVANLGVVAASDVNSLVPFDEDSWVEGVPITSNPLRILGGTVPSRSTMSITGQEKVSVPLLESTVISYASCSSFFTVGADGGFRGSCQIGCEAEGTVIAYISGDSEQSVAQQSSLYCSPDGESYSAWFSFLTRTINSNITAFSSNRVVTKVNETVGVRFRPVNTLPPHIMHDYNSTNTDWSWLEDHLHLAKDAILAIFGSVIIPSMIFMVFALVAICLATKFSYRGLERFVIGPGACTPGSFIIMTAPIAIVLWIVSIVLFSLLGKSLEEKVYSMLFALASVATVVSVSVIIYLLIMKALDSRKKVYTGVVMDDAAGFESEEAEESEPVVAPPARPKKAIKRVTIVDNPNKV